jgi:hypothetical protein
MSIYSDIRTALETRLYNTSNIPVVAWENVDYSPTTGTPFIKFQFQPTSRRPAVRGTNPQMRYQGLVTLLVHQPENEGPINTEELVDDLVSRFDATTDISYNGIFVRIEYTERQNSYLSKPWYVTPIRIAWYSYVQ